MNADADFIFLRGDSLSSTIAATSKARSSAGHARCARRRSSRRTIGGACLLTAPALLALAARFAREGTCRIAQCRLFANLERLLLASDFVGHEQAVEANQDRCHTSYFEVGRMFNILSKSFVKVSILTVWLCNLSSSGVHGPWLTSFCNV